MYISLHASLASSIVREEVKILNLLSSTMFSPGLRPKWCRDGTQGVWSVGRAQPGPSSLRLWMYISLPPSLPSGELLAAIERDFGSLDNFRSQMTAKTVAVQGSGWGWLVSANSSGWGWMVSAN